MNRPPIVQSVLSVHILILAALIFDHGPAFAESPVTDNQDRFRVQYLGTVTSPFLREASGIALSRKEPNVFWSHNDSGYGAFLFASKMDGSGLVRYFVKNAVSRDWEDIAAFEWKGKSWLLIADVGDNSGRRDEVFLYLIEEPDIPKNVKATTIKISAQHVIKMRYPDGAADCESVAVDAEEEKIYLLTKRQRPPRLYSVPLDAMFSEQITTASFEGEVKGIPPASAMDILENPAFGPYRGQPTAMDISPDRQSLVVNTYARAWLFTRAPGESWLQTLNGEGTALETPTMKQSEAICFDHDSQSLIVTSEGRNPPVYRMSPVSLPGRIQSRIAEEE